LDDIEIINLELNLADLSQLEKRRERIQKQVRTSKEAAKEDLLFRKKLKKSYRKEFQLDQYL
jgi:hypothetical protein